MNPESPTLILMCRSLNALWARVRRAHPRASRTKLEFAMAAVLRRLEAVDNALGKEWMQWLTPPSPQRESAGRCAKRLQRQKKLAPPSP